MKRDIDDVISGLDKLSAMITVIGTFCSQHKCETEEVEVSAETKILAADMLADYAQILREQLVDLQYPESKTIKIPEVPVPAMKIQTKKAKTS